MSIRVSLLKSLPGLHEVGVANMTREVYLCPLPHHLLRVDAEVSRLELFLC